MQQPNKREIVRLTMALVGRGGQGDVGQRIRDEILVIQVYSSTYVSAAKTFPSLVRVV